MTDKKQQPEGVDQGNMEPVKGLVTDWADSLVPENFDRDQAAVNDWMEASDEERLMALERNMTLGDAEELAATARAVASEHMRRAERARNLVTIIAARLGRESEALRATETAKAVPVMKNPDPTPTRATPASSQASIANLPSAR